MLMKTKKCLVCKETKQLELFSKDPKRKDGHHGNCKLCSNKKSREFRERNPGYDRRHDATRLAGYDQAYHTEYQRRRRQECPLERLKANLRSRLSVILKKKGLIKSKRTADLIGLKSGIDLVKYIENQWKKGMSWDNYGNTKGCWNIDHIIPYASANTIEEVEKLTHYTNLQPLWWDENLRKSDKILLDA